MDTEVVRRGIEAVETFERVDRPAEAAQERVRRVLPDGRATELAAGRWLGHPVHPVLVQVPIGAWLSAAVLDLVPGQERAARRLVATGLVAAPIAAAAGLLDVRDLDRRQLRVAAVHALSNLAATVSYAASYRCRLRGDRRAGRFWAWLGLAAVGVGGTLGGHLSYAQGAGVGRWRR